MVVKTRFENCGRKIKIFVKNRPRKRQIKIRIIIINTGITSEYFEYNTRIRLCIVVTRKVQTNLKTDILNTIQVQHAASTHAGQWVRACVYIYACAARAVCVCVRALNARARSPEFRKTKQNTKYL